MDGYAKSGEFQPTKKEYPLSSRLCYINLLEEEGSDFRHLYHTTNNV